MNIRLFSDTYINFKIGNIVRLGQILLYDNITVAKFSMYLPMCIYQKFSIYI